MYFAKSPRYPGEIHCEALSSDLKAQQLCKSYGPVGTVTGTDGTFTAYVIQGSGEDAGEVSGGGTSVSSWVEAGGDSGCWGDGVGTCGFDAQNHLISVRADQDMMPCTDDLSQCTQGADALALDENGKATLVGICSSVNSDGSCDGYSMLYEVDRNAYELASTCYYVRTCSSVEGTTCSGDAWSDWTDSWMPYGEAFKQANP